MWVLACASKNMYVSVEMSEGVSMCANTHRVCVHLSM